MGNRVLATRGEVLDNGLDIDGSLYPNLRNQGRTQRDAAGEARNNFYPNA
jgi:hypothetical protein